MNLVFAVFYEGQLLVTISYRPAVSLSLVLDSYSEQYDFDRSKLTATVVDLIQFSELRMP